jgi:uracil-DNA glycosylase
MSLSELVPTFWKSALREALAAPSFTELNAFLDAELQAKQVIFPPREKIFAALAHTAPADVKVVIIGQDPYPTAGNANGLSFSVSPGVKIPGSLRNLFAALAADVGTPAKPTTGDLSPWAQQGVLLLNTVLTVREGEANSHQGHGWEPLTQAIVTHVNSLDGPVVFLCFGKHAQALATQLVDAKKHAILSEPHPSPLNGRKCVDSVTANKTFTRVNEILKTAGRTPIDWALP